MRNLLVVVAATYIVSSFIGYFLIASRFPPVVAYNRNATESIRRDPIISTIVSAILSGNLVFAITETFLWNLTFGAFVTTTLPGVIPLVGTVIPLLVSAFHGFENGLILYHAFGISTASSIAALGTAILELTAYVFSSAAGINISLSTAFPRLQGVKSRRRAFRKAWRDAARLYLIIIALLATAAVWEIVSIYVVRVMK